MGPLRSCLIALKRVSRHRFKRLNQAKAGQSYRRFHQSAKTSIWNAVTLQRNAPRPLAGAADHARSSGWLALERPRSRWERPTSRIGQISLGEDDLVHLIFGHGSPSVSLGEKNLGIESGLGFPFYDGGFPSFVSLALETDGNNVGN